MCGGDRTRLGAVGDEFRLLAVALPIVVRDLPGIRDGRCGKHGREALGNQVPGAPQPVPLLPVPFEPVDVERRGQERAAFAQHGPQQHHRGYALALPGEGDEGERHAPDQRADHDREQRRPQAERRHEQRPRHHDEQPDGPVEPQDGHVPPVEAAMLRLERTDARGRSVRQDPAEPFGDARHARSLRRSEPDQVPRVAGGGSLAVANRSRPLSPVPRTPPPPDRCYPPR